MERNKPHFTSLLDWVLNTQAMATLGGIQELEIQSTDIKVTWIQASIGASGSKPEKIYADIYFKVYMKDWFGVDWTDLVGDMASVLFGDGLAAFWILQHHRGFPALKNILLYNEKQFCKIK